MTLSPARRMSRVAIRPFKSVLEASDSVTNRALPSFRRFDRKNQILALPFAISSTMANVGAVARRARSALRSAEVCDGLSAMSGDPWDDELPSEADLARFDAAVDERSSVTAAAVQLGITQLHDWQRRVVDAWLAGRDALVLSGTGSGKSACYMLPAVISRANGCRGVALVITPLISLARDQVLRLTN